MSVPFPGFVGISYSLENQYASSETLKNWFIIANESMREEKKFDYLLHPCPANALFSHAEVPVPSPFNQPSRGLLEVRGKVFGVNGDRVFEYFSDGSYAALGPDPTMIIANDGKPVSMVANGNRQIFIASAGQGYVIDAAGGLSAISTPEFLGAAYSTFQDGYILNVVPNSNRFQISGDDTTPVGDALVWSALNVVALAGQADFLRAMISSREYIRLLGHRRSQVFQNVGNAGIGGFPFQSYNETFIETGCAAAFSLAELGDSLMWIGEDARGMRACWRDTAFSPQRVSTFAVERIWQGYSSVEDAIAFSFLWMGHLFYQVTFPSAIVDEGGNATSRTWLYDATVSQLTGRQIWSERSFTDPATGQQWGRPEITHAYCFGAHLVGSGGSDGNPGAIYAYSNTAYQDVAVNQFGVPGKTPMVCERTCPHIYEVDQNVVYNRITFELARGQGNGTGIAPGSDPQLLLSWSNDGGMTFGAEYSLSMGKQGEFIKRVFMNQLGYAPRGGGGRVFRVKAADPVFNSLISAQLDYYGCAP